MILKNVRFVGSAVTASQFPKDNLPQIVFSGRSNVGKSSFINAMLNRKNIARISQTPGKTRLINFFLLNDDVYFVDIPGYGYANVSKQMLTDFHVMIDQYLSQGHIALAVLLLDIRRTPNEDDHLMFDYFRAHGFSVLCVLTKADKLSNNQIAKQKKIIKSAFDNDEGIQLVTFSAKTLLNREHLWEIIDQHVREWSHE